MALSSVGAVFGTFGNPGLVSFIDDFFRLVFESFLLDSVWEVTGLLSFDSWTGFVSVFCLLASVLTTCTFGFGSFVAPVLCFKLALDEPVLCINYTVCILTHTWTVALGIPHIHIWQYHIAKHSYESINRSLDTRSERYWFSLNIFNFHHVHDYWRQLY